MSGLDNAIHGLEQALASSPQQTWRGLIRQRMASVHEALANDRSRVGDAWQAARDAHLKRERKTLVERMRRLDATEDINPVEVRRLLLDIEHHRQRVNDLVYDSVSMDLGGSE